MPPPPPISKQGLWDPRSSEEQAGRRWLDPEGLVAGTPSAWTQLSQRRGCPLLLTAGVAALGQGKGRASLGKWGRLKLLPGRDLSHRILSTLSAWFLLLCNKNRRFPRPAARRGRAGTPARDPLLNQPWDPGVRIKPRAVLSSFRLLGPERARRSAWKAAQRVGIPATPSSGRGWE